MKKILLLLVLVSTAVYGAVVYYGDGEAVFLEDRLKFEKSGVTIDTAASGGAVEITGPTIQGVRILGQFGASLTLLGTTIQAESGGGDASMTLQHQEGGSVNRFDGTTYSKLGANPDYQELMKHPSFELDHEGVCSNCDATLVPSITLTPEDKNRLELVFSEGGTYTVDIDTGAGFGGLPATASCYVNTTNTDVQMAQRTNGVNGAIENVVSGGSEVLVIPSKQGLAGTTSTGYQIIAGSAGTVYLNNCSINTENKIYQVSNASNWVDAGTITIGATTTTPSKGSPTVDQIGYSRQGDKATIRGALVLGSGSTVGSGDYLFSLPDGLQFDPNKTEFFTTVIGGGSSFNSKAAIGSAVVNDSANQLIGTILPYDATRFRLGGVYHGPASGGRGVVGSAFFDTSASGKSYSFDFDAYIEGWGATTDAMSAQAVGARLDVSNEGTTSSVTIGNAEITAPFDTIKEEKNISWSTSNNEATIQVAGLYEISPELIILNGAAAADSQIFPEVDTGSGYAELTTVSKCRINTSNASTDRMRGACRFLVKLNTGDKVRVQVASNHASTLLLNTSPRYGRLVINRVWDEEQINALITETVKYDGSEMLDRERIDNGDGTTSQVYKKCYRVPSQIDTDSVIFNAGENLNPVGLISHAANQWVLATYHWSTNIASIFYNASTGNVSADIEGSYVVEAGTRFCMRYTR